nr:glycosyltransferase [Mycobacterium aquaticum]
MPENLRSQSPIAIPDIIYRVLARCAWKDAARVLNHAGAVTAPTYHAAEILRRRAGVANAIPISCGVDISAFTPNDERISSQPSVLFVGRLELEKHVDQIIRALPIMTCPAELRIVGTGSQERSLRDLTTALGLHDRIRFLGYLNDDQLIAEFNCAGAFCMPGTAELQSIATLEAMAAGLPVVAADAHALPELVSPGVNGELFPPGDVKRLAWALDQVLLDEQRRTAYAKSSRELVTRHELSRTVEEFEKLYANTSIT